MKIIKIKRIFKDVPVNFSGIAINENGDKAWYKNGLLHRKDNPAIEMENGYKAWYKNGERYRLNGPIVEYPNGDKAYLINKEGTNTINVLILK